MTGFLLLVAWRLGRWLLPLTTAFALIQTAHLGNAALDLLTG